MSKDATHSDAVLNWLKGTTFTAAPATLYVALVKSSGYSATDRSTWVEPNNTSSATALTAGGSDIASGYTRPAITFGTISTVTGYREMAGNQIAGSANQYAWNAFAQQVTLAGIVLCTSSSASLATCGVRGVDTSSGTVYAAGTQAAVTPANVKVREQ